MSFNEASRLLIQASFGADKAEIERVRSLGVDAWLDEQFAIKINRGHVKWLQSKDYDSPGDNFPREILDHTVWRKFLGNPDGLRQRMVFALSQILVISVESLGHWGAFSAAYYVDILEKHAFGNFRDLLQDVSLSPAMGRFLSIRRSRAADDTGRRPDENYAREIMQLFTIGLVKLNDDCTPALDGNGQPQPAYTESDVSGLASVFTGYEYANNDKVSNESPDVLLRPMVNNARYHESKAKTFLGTTIPADTAALPSLGKALDTLFNHPNVGPFICKQLIQRFVTSNPSPGYVKRVAAVFAKNDLDKRGDLAAVLHALLTDVEARDTALAKSDPAFGRLREPVLRFAQFARACKMDSPSGDWKVKNLSNPVERLGQNPMRSPSVFNFYRPGYVPPNSPLAKSKKVGPEFQITTESSVAGYINFMQSVISIRDGVTGSDVKPNYSNWLANANDDVALANEANAVLAAGQLSAPRVQLIVDALKTMPKNTTDLRIKRVQVAVLLTVVAPEFISLK